MISSNDPRLALAYSGRHDGVAFRCSPHRYGKGMVLTLDNDVRDLWKDRAAWLAEALGGKWARGHQQGYRIAPTRAAQWRALYLAGWDAHVPFRWSDVAPQPARFSLNGGPKLTLKEAMKQAEVAP